MLSVFVNDKKEYKLPESWNELSGQQLIAIAPILLKKEISIQEQWYVAHTLCGFKSDLYTVEQSRQKNGYDYLANEIREKILPLIQFLFDKNELTKQLIPVIEVAGEYKFFGTTELYGPIDDFNNITIAEFSDTESCLNMFEETRDALWLHRFLAIMYRPKKKKASPHSADFDGDVRVPYNFHCNDLIAVKTGSIDERIKCAILLWYYGCRAEFVANNKFLFQSASSGDSGSGGITDLIHALAGPKFGTVEETGKVLLKVAVRELKLLHEANANQP